MKKRTDETPAVTAVPDCGPAIPAEHVARMAAILADLGYTAAFCRRQPQDRDFWLQLAAALDRRPGAAPGAAPQAAKLRIVGVPGERPDGDHRRGNRTRSAMPAVRDARGPPVPAPAGRRPFGEVPGRAPQWTRPSPTWRKSISAR